MNFWCPYPSLPWVGEGDPCASELSEGNFCVSGEQKRRIAAVFLPELLCELTQEDALSLSRGGEPARGVLLAEQVEDVREADVLAAVNARALRAGVRPGMTSSEAHAQLAGLQIGVVEVHQVQSRLVAIAEAAAQWGSSPSWALGTGAGATQSWAKATAFDTIWLDVTGVAHLHGGELPLMEELANQVRLLGHRVRVAVAPGPRIAQALARFGSAPLQSISDSDAKQAMSSIPLSALPLDGERIAWLGRLGIYEVGQLAQLPPSAASARLGPHAVSILELVQGLDREPLVPGRFPRTLEEQSEWDEPAEGISPLLFAVHGLVARLSARLRGRGEACCFLECILQYDRAVARHRGVVPQTSLEFELSTPLHKEADFERILRARLERIELDAPTVGLSLRASRLTPQVQQQLGLSQRAARSFLSSGSHAQEFPVLLAELQSDVGREAVGVLQLRGSMLPEERSALLPFQASSSTRRQSSRRSSSSGGRGHAWINPCPQMDRLTRLLPIPQRVGVPLRKGEIFALGGELFTIEKVVFVQRLGDAHWWKQKSVSRDYHWAWLRSPRGGTEALLFFDRAEGRAYLQALCD